MVLPQIPFLGVVIFPIICIYLIIFTDIRYNFKPELHISDGTTFASLVVGFILLYAMQKFDTIDLNVPTVSRAILYLKKVALKYNPKLICYLIKYCKGFLCLEIDNYALHCFEREILPLIPSEAEKARVVTTVTTLETIYNQRISLTNTIAEPIWYLVFISGIILTIIFPMDYTLRKIDAILVLLLIWLPITFIYSLYLSELDALESIIEDTIVSLKECTEDMDDYCSSLDCRYKCNPNLNSDIDNILSRDIHNMRDKYWN